MMTKVRISCTMSLDVLEDVKAFASEFGKDTKVRINVSEAIQILVSEALEARIAVQSHSTKASEISSEAPAQPKGIVAPYQRPAFNPVPKPGGKS